MGGFLLIWARVGELGLLVVSPGRSSRGAPFFGPELQERDPNKCFLQDLLLRMCSPGAQCLVGPGRGRHILVGEHLGHLSAPRSSLRCATQSATVTSSPPRFLSSPACRNRMRLLPVKALSF